MPVVSVEEPSGERSVSGESGRPRGTTESITPHPSRLSEQAIALVPARGSRYRPASPFPPKPPTN